MWNKSWVTFHISVSLLLFNTRPERWTVFTEITSLFNYKGASEEEEKQRVLAMSVKRRQKVDEQERSKEIKWGKRGKLTAEEETLGTVFRSVSVIDWMLMFVFSISNSESSSKLMLLAVVMETYSTWNFHRSSRAYFPTFWPFCTSFSVNCFIFPALLMEWAAIK